MANPARLQRRAARELQGDRLPLRGGTGVRRARRADFPNVEIASRVKAVAGRATTRRGIKYEIEENGLLATGSSPAPTRRSAEQHLSVFDADRYTESAFRWIWSETGGRFTGKVRAGTTPAGATLFHRFESEPLAAPVRDMNKFSMRGSSSSHSRRRRARRARRRASGSCAIGSPRSRGPGPRAGERLGAVAHGTHRLPRSPPSCARRGPHPRRRVSRPRSRSSRWTAPSTRGTAPPPAGAPERRHAHRRAVRGGLRAGRARAGAAWS